MSAATSETLSAEPEPRRRRRSPWRRVFVVVAALVVVALVAVVAFVVVTVRKPLPQVDGEVTLTGLDAAVTVVRNNQGVPDIYASTASDLFKAQGYVQAQDRFFQMDVRRHIASGRLAELVGDNPDAIKADKVIRTLGWRQVADEEYKVLDPQTKEYLQAYSDGVNAYLNSRSSTSDIAVEYTILAQRVNVSQPALWTPVDSLTWLKAMAWDLRSNYDDELARAEIYAGLGQTSKEQQTANMAQVDKLFPPYPNQNPTILQSDENQGAPAGPDAATSADTDLLDDSAAQGALSSANAALGAVPHLVGEGEGVGSNSWVVAGKYTASGSPILANDPHLALTAPGVWTQVGLHCSTVTDECPFDVSGFSFAGFPGVIIGHNNQVAWGLTNMGADVTDFFVERVRGDEYLTGDTFEPLTERTETIKVNGGQDIDITVRSTKHGPIVSGVLDGTDTVDKSPAGENFGEYDVSLAWTALEPGHTADAVFALDRAQDVDDIRTAAKSFDVPAQNIVFATKDGHIGYQAPGKVPVRPQVTDGPVPADGSWPRPGYDPRYDWAGYVPFDQMPWTLDPASGIIVAANQAVLPAGSGPFLTGDWDYGYRAARISELLQAEVTENRPMSVDTMAGIQNDTHSPYADVLVPFLLEQPIDNDFDAAGQKLLENWDRNMDPDSAAAAYFAAVWRNLLKYTFWDELPKDARPDGGSRWLAVMTNLLEDPTDDYWDDKTTYGLVEGGDEILTKALTSARRDLTVDLGKDTSDWSWGKLHKLDLEHELLSGSSVPSLVADFLTPSAVAVGGGSSIVDATSWDAASGSFDVTTGPSMRMVVDLGRMDQSTWVTVTGVSGHPASSHYADQLDSWTHGEAYRWRFTTAAVKSAGDKTLTLTP